MLTKKDIAALQFSYDNYKPIGPEYHYKDANPGFFINGSVDNHIARLKLYYENSQYRSMTLNENILQINEIKEMLNNTNRPYGFYCREKSNEQSFNNKFVTLISKVISKHIITDQNNFFNDWRELADKYQIDISKEQNDKDILLNKIDRITKIDQIVNEVSMAFKNIDELIKIQDQYGETSKEYFEKYDKVKIILNELDCLNSYIHLNKVVADENIIDYFEELKPILKSIENKIRLANPEIEFSRAEKFSNLMKSSPLNNFITEKTEITENQFVVDLNYNNLKIKRIIIFKDDFSICLKDKDNNLNILDNINERNKLIENIFKTELSYRLRKSPRIAKLFIEKLEEDYNLIEDALAAADTYIQHEAILKSKDFDLLDEIEDSLFETLDDNMNAFIKDFKLKQYAHSIASNKYLDLYNDESYEIIALLKELDISKEVLQSTIGKKMAAYKDSEQFNAALEKLYTINSKFNPTDVKETAQNCNAEIISDVDNVLVIRIDNHDQSKQLGSGSWCIVREESYFRSYTDQACQYFIYDFNKSAKNNDSLIGLTLHSTGDVSASHLKNDDQLRTNDFIKDIQLKIIMNDELKYDKLKDEFKELITTERSKLKNTRDKMKL